MKKKTIIGLICILLIVLAGGVFVSKQSDLKDKLYLNLNLKLAKELSMGDEIYKVDNQKNVSMWNLDLQNIVEKKIAKKSKNATFEEPFIVYNPYGTNTCAINVLYNTKEDTSLEYTISVEDSTISDFTRVAYNGEENNLTKNHSYQLIGLVPDVLNNVTLKQLDKDGNVLAEKSFTIQMGSLVTDSTPHLEIKEGTSTQELSNGLFALLGHDKAFNANIYMYDNDGVIRSELPLKKYRTDRLLFIGDEMAYSYDLNKIAFVNREGKITRKYDLGIYELHHDFIYDEVNDSILVLANEKGTDTIEDVIARVDLKTGEVSKLIDMKDYMLSVKEVAVPPEGKNTYGGTELDWIHINTIDLVDGKDLILSSRELSTIIRLNNIYENPEIAYFISDPSVWEGTEYEGYLLDKVGDFVSQAGQHTVTYLEDEALGENQYYIYMFNNNYRGASTRPNFDWSAYEGTGTFEKGDKSLFYQYLVDENAGTYELVKSVDLPYSSIVSSTQYFGGNIVTSSGKSHCFNEFDLDGNLIRQYNYTSEKYAYRCLKYDFNNFWFN